MVLWGTAVNAAAIIAGGLLGLLLPKLKDGIKETVMQGLGLSVVVLGFSMALKSDNFLVVIACLVAGGIAGELLRIDKGLQWLGTQLERLVGNGGSGKVATGFVTTTLIYCIGAMAVLGSLQSGMEQEHSILYTKSMLDGFSAVIFASTLGVGVLFSAIPVFIYQGIIALAATWIALAFGDVMLNEMITQITAVGGILIIGIGLNVLEIKKVNVANLLPAIVMAALSVPVMALWN
ncbi:membrane protein [Paenibacillus swuensis]|uniref:Membrane protein n=1 Tax=Paenibacillus swuensis TaxID=1178515 RepID=A0A172TIZ5_9BACL|nr:DUF554 domain-containing protein [Paenibacillus swuensis]ANE46980.1 membrane protein [Paenibacillus swuensis]